MILPGTLNRYFAKRFISTTIAVFFGAFALVVMIDYIEMMRKSAEVPGVSAWLVAKTSFFRVPQVTERIMPFCILIGGMTCFLNLSRRLEFVIARSVGMSAWQFTMPAIVSALFLGVLATTIYNPLSAAMQEQSKRLEAEIFGATQTGNFSETPGGSWIRQRSPSGQSIMNAQTSREQGIVLSGVTVFTFDDAGHFKERIEAKSAALKSGYWELEEANIYAIATRVDQRARYQLPTSLTVEQVRESFATPETVPFWRLPAYIELADRSGLGASGYRLQYQKLLARPFLLASMVFIAAAVSLRLARFGGVQTFVLIGILGGFFIFVFSKVIEDLSKAGIVSPLAAAWVPVLLGTIAGFMTLLHQEDG